MKNTAAATALTIAPMLPIWFAKPCRNALSVVVLVSAEEFANSASIVLETSGPRLGSMSRSTIQPMESRSKVRASLKYS